MSKPFDSPISMPTRLSSQPGIMRSSPMTSGMRSARAALEWLAVDRADELHAGDVVRLAAARSSIGRSVACCSRSSAMTCSICSSVTSGISRLNG